MLTNEELNTARKEGFRPSVLCCCINENKVLILYNKEYSFWMFPQGGIDNGETLDVAVVNALTGDFTAGFSADCDSNYLVLGDEQVEFAPGKHNITELKTDEGEVIDPKGKKYYFVAIYKKDPTIDLTNTQYNEYFWVGYKAGMFLANKIPQKGKKRITSKALDLLKEKGLIA